MKSKSKNGRGPVTKRAPRLPKGPKDADAGADAELPPALVAELDALARRIVEGSAWSVRVRRLQDAATAALDRLDAAMGERPGAIQSTAAGAAAPEIAPSLLTADVVIGPIAWSGEQLASVIADGLTRDWGEGAGPGPALGALMRRTFQDLAREAGVSDVVTRAIDARGASVGEVRRAFWHAMDRAMYGRADRGAASNRRRAVLHRARQNARRAVRRMVIR